LTRKKTIIIAGGTDCVSFPQIGYGNFQKPILKLFTKWSFKLCTVIAPKHHTLWNYIYRYDAHEPEQQGISAFINTKNKQVVPIENGYDANQWPLLNLEREPNSFITVTGGLQYPFQKQLKGLDLILEIAPHFPDSVFTIIGVPHEHFFGTMPGNVRALPPMKNDLLPQLFNTQQFYLQLSMAEGFPNALCEAMLSGCTPIVSAVFSMPEITETVGYSLQHRNTGELVELIKEALNNGPHDPTRVRNSIATRYTLERRKEKLRALMQSIR
jgi:hypothetical protein